MTHNICVCSVAAAQQSKAIISSIQQNCTRVRGNKASVRRIYDTNVSIQASAAQLELHGIGLLIQTAVIPFCGRIFLWCCNNAKSIAVHASNTDS